MDPSVDDPHVSLFAHRLFRDVRFLSRLFSAIQSPLEMRAKRRREEDIQGASAKSEVGEAVMRVPCWEICCGGPYELNILS